MNPVSFVVLGEPVPQPRPRVSTRGGFARAYVPKTHPVHAYRQAIAAAARAAGLRAVGHAVQVEIVAEFARPKSHMNKRGVKPDAPKYPRADVDNIAKAVLDALGPIIGDDTQVCSLHVIKAYGPQAFTHVEVET
jgi:Holliday junction resolvase RusA-like endonuclease